MTLTPPSTMKLFSPERIKNNLFSRNRIVMAPMTRGFSPQGIPGSNVVDYYQRRAASGVGLIITEGIYIPHGSAGFNPKVPHITSPQAKAGWRQVVTSVHAAGGLIAAQLWHVGGFVQPHERPHRDHPPFSPSGLGNHKDFPAHIMNEKDCETMISAYVEAALAAKEIGFDAIELHGAHGYLIDQFFWDHTNKRQDKYGGNINQRTRFAVEIIKAIRDKVGPHYPIIVRFSQWKQQDYYAQLAKTPKELESFLTPLVEAGTDVFHCSSRRFWDAEFKGDPRGLAGWTKQLSGKPTITVGSVTLEIDIKPGYQHETVHTTDLQALIYRLDQGEFDFVAIGRALLANYNWPELVKNGHLDQLRPFRKSELSILQ